MHKLELSATKNARGRDRVETHKVLILLYRGFNALTSGHKSTPIGHYPHALLLLDHSNAHILLEDRIFLACHHAIGGNRSDAGEGPYIESCVPYCRHLPLPLRFSSRLFSWRAHIPVGGPNSSKNYLR